MYADGDDVWRPALDLIFFLSYYVHTILQNTTTTTRLVQTLLLQPFWKKVVLAHFARRKLATHSHTRPIFLVLSVQSRRRPVGWHPAKQNRFEAHPRSSMTSFSVNATATCRRMQRSRMDLPASFPLLGTGVGTTTTITREWGHNVRVIRLMFLQILGHVFFETKKIKQPEIQAQVLRLVAALLTTLPNLLNGVF